jgi:hypothetical protein
MKNQIAAEVAASIRTLQIESDGDAWKGRLKPKIRLTGRWLERAGFPPGERVQVACVAPGIIELRSTQAPLPELEPPGAS